MMKLLERLRELLFYDSSMIKVILYAILILVVVAIANRFISIAIDKLLERDKAQKFDRTIVTFIKQLIHLLVYMLGLILYANLVPSLKSLGQTLLAGVSIVSVIFAITAQNTLGNFIAGIALLIYRPFQIGDSLIVNSPGGQSEGVVESINLGYTILRVGKEETVLIPNIIMTTSTCIKTKGKF